MVGSDKRIDDTSEVMQHDTQQSEHTNNEGQGTCYPVPRLYNQGSHYLDIKARLTTLSGDMEALLRRAEHGILYKPNYAADWIAYYKERIDRLLNDIKLYEDDKTRHTNMEDTR